MFTLLSIFVIFISSGLTAAFNYIHAPLNISLQLISVLLLVLLVLSRKYLFSSDNPVISKAFKLFFLFLTTLFVQLLVSLTGNFYSPFLISLHLFSLGLSFLLNLPISIGFISFSVLVLFVNIYLNPSLLSQLYQDPFSVILYLASFVVIIPLSIILTRTYHLKDSLSRVLSNSLVLGKKRETSILGGLDEMVFVTDILLRVISVNQSAEELLNLSSEEMTHKILTDVLPLIDSDQLPATLQSLAIEDALKDKTTRLINGFSIKVPNKPLPTPITIQVSPIPDTSGRVNQITFVINEAQKGRVAHDNLTGAFIKNKNIINSLKKASVSLHASVMEEMLELLSSYEMDLITAEELEDHQIQEKIEPVDIAAISKGSSAKKQKLATFLKIPINFYLSDEDSSETALLSLIDSDVRSSAFAVSPFLVMTDAKWISILIEKLIDLAMFASKEGGQVEVFPIQDANNVYLKIYSLNTSLGKDELGNLFKDYYPAIIQKTNLNLASGLEGFIAKTISEQLNIPRVIKIEYKDNRPALLIQIKLSKVPRKS